MENHHVDKEVQAQIRKSQPGPSVQRRGAGQPKGRRTIGRTRRKFLEREHPGTGNNRDNGLNREYEKNTQSTGDNQR